MARTKPNRSVIYGLFDPRVPIELSNVRYIGQTTIEEEDRLTDHINAAIRANPDYPVYKWIRKVLAGDARPIVRVLETVTTDPLPEELKNELCETWLDVREVAWITSGKQQKWRLVNATPGGRSGDRLSEHPDREEICQRISTALTGRKLSDSHRANISKARKGVPLPESTKQSISEAMTGNPKAGNGSRAFKAMREADPELDAAWRAQVSERAIRLGTGYQLAATFKNMLETDPVFAAEQKERARKMGQATKGRKNPKANQGRRKCLACEMVCSPANMGYHQKSKGHVGWEDVTAVPVS